MNNLRHFHANVAASKNGSQHASYRLVDKLADVNSNALKIYYRLKMVDLDGTFNYSNVLLISLSGNLFYSISPNPAKNIVYAKGVNIESVQLADNAGRLILNCKGNSQSVIQLYITHLSAGLYLVTFNSKDAQEKQKKLIIRR